jgi:C4-dicarboxylate transporter DctQ subunit
MFIKLLNRTEEIVLCILLSGMTLLVFVDVILRFGFNSGFLWSDELTLYISAWFVLFGASYGLKVGAHIGVDAFVKKLPGKSRRIVTLVAVVLCCIYCGLFLYGSWIYLAKMKMIGIEMDDLPVPKWEAMTILIFGFVMLTIRLLILLWHVITGKQEGFHMVDEAEESMQIARDIAEIQAAEERLKGKTKKDQGTGGTP